MTPVIKTGKREAGVAGLILALANIITAYLFESEMAVKILDITYTPTLMFAATMFGADWLGKQSPWAKPVVEPEVLLD